MRTKTELYREAKRRVESRRQRAVTEAVARRAASAAARRATASVTARWRRLSTRRLASR